MVDQVIRLQYGSDPYQYGDLRVPEGAGPHPVLMLIHGGFWRARYDLHLMDAMANDWQARGYVTWNIEYRRVGQPGGGWPGTAEDVVSAVGYLAAISDQGLANMDLSRFGVVGHSAGGHLALWQATRYWPREIRGAQGELQVTIKPQAVIALAPVSDLVSMHKDRIDDSPVAAFLGGLPEEETRAYQEASPITNLPIGVPQVIVHGTADTNVPYEQSVRYVQAARQAGDTMHWIGLVGIDHFAIIDPKSDVWQRIVDAVEQVMAAGI